MSYHILHQFDEQWFASNGQDNDAARSREAFGVRGDGRQQSSPHPTSQRCPSLIIIAALLIAACALYFALDARRHAADLQQRLSEFETTMKK